MKNTTVPINSYSAGLITQLAKFDNGNNITEITFHRNKEWLIVGGYWQVRLWDIESESLIRTVGISGGDKPFYLLSNDNNLLASFDGNKYQFESMWILDLRTGEEIFREKMVPVCFNIQGTEIAVKGYQGNSLGYYAVDIKTGEHRLLYQYDEMSYGELSPDWRFVAVTSLHARSLQIRDIETNNVVVDLYHGPTNYYSVRFTADSNHAIMVFSPPGSMRSDSYLWDLNSGSEIIKYSSERFETAIALSPNGKILYLGTDESVKILDVTTNEIMGILKIQHPIPPIFNIDGSVLVTGTSTEDFLKLCDAKTAKSLVMLSGHSQYITARAFNNEGTLICSSDAKGTIRIWGIPE